MHWKEQKDKKMRKLKYEELDYNFKIAELKEKIREQKDMVEASTQYRVLKELRERSIKKPRISRGPF